MTVEEYYNEYMDICKTLDIQNFWFTKVRKYEVSEALEFTYNRKYKNYFTACDFRYIEKTLKFQEYYAWKAYNRFLEKKFWNNYRNNLLFFKEMSS